MVSNKNNAVVCLALKEYGQVGPKLFQQLLVMYGEPINIFERTPDEISSMTGINLERAQKIVDSQDLFGDTVNTLDYLETINISVISFFDDLYPDALRKITDPPLGLYVKGDGNLLHEGGVAIVGAAEADQKGIKAAVDMARELSNNDIIVISGLAAGIDSAAHLGCLKNNGKTIAVLGCGHLNIYPEENTHLADLIAESGAVISEFDVHADAVPGRLVSRNRIIAALADIVIIAQLSEKRRGELHAARAAIEQGKPVYVFDPDDRYDDETLLNNQIVKMKELAEIDEIIKYMA